MLICSTMQAECHGSGCLAVLRRLTLCAAQRSLGRGIGRPAPCGRCTKLRRECADTCTHHSRAAYSGAGHSDNVAAPAEAVGRSGAHTGAAAAAWAAAYTLLDSRNARLNARLSFSSFLFVAAYGMV